MPRTKKISQEKKTKKKSKALKDLVRDAGPNLSEYEEKWNDKAIVTSPAEFRRLAYDIIILQALYNKYESDRKAKKAPFLEHAKLVDSEYSFVKEVEAVLSMLRKLACDYERNMSAKRLKQAKKEVKALKDKDRAEDIVALVRATPPAEVHVDGLEWAQDITVSVTDHTKVPANILVVDTSKTKSRVKAARKLGITEFPGLEIKETFALRVKRPSGIEPVDEDG